MTVRQSVQREKPTHPMHTFLATLACLPLLSSTPTADKGPTFAPFEQSFVLVNHRKEVDSIALYLAHPCDIRAKGSNNLVELFEIRQKCDLTDMAPIATFSRATFSLQIDQPGFYVMRFFRDGEETWARHHFSFDSHWSQPPGRRFERSALKLEVHPFDEERPHWLQGAMWRDR